MQLRTRIRFVMVASIVCWSTRVAVGQDSSNKDWSCSLVPLQAEYMVNEPILARGELTNNSAETLTLLKAKNRGYEFAVSGDRQATRPRDPRAGWGLRFAKSVEAGETVNDLPLINEGCRFTKPGEYEVECRKTVYYYASPNLAEGQLQTTTVTCSVIITVIPEDTRKMQQLASSLLEEALKPRGDDRYLAMRKLAWVTSEAAAPYLIQAMRSEYADVQRAGVRGLSRIGSDDAKHALLAHFESLKPEAKALAIMLLGSLGVQEARAPITPYLQDGDKNVREAALGALARLGDPAAIQEMNDRQVKQLEAAKREMEEFLEEGKLQPSVVGE